MMVSLKKKLRKLRRQANEQPDIGQDINMFDKNKLIIQDMFAPDGCEHLFDKLKLGADQMCRVYVIHAIPRILQVGWLDEIFYRAGNVDLSVHLVPAPDRQVINDLIKKETRAISQRELDRQSGNISRLPELEAAISDYHGLREAVQLGQDRLYYVVIFIAIHASSEDELRRRCGSVEDVLARKNVSVRALVLRQLEGLKAVLPIGKNKISGNWKNLTTGAAVCCLPASTVAVGHASGALMGFNTSTKSPIFIDRFAGEHIVSNQHMFINGESGSGKSVTCRLLTLREAALGTKSLLIDPEGEVRQEVA